MASASDIADSNIQAVLYSEMGPQNFFNTFAPDCIVGRYNLNVLGMSVSTRLLTQPADSTGWTDFLRDNELELSRVISEKFGYDPNLNNSQIVQFFLRHAEVAHLYAIGTRARNIYTSLRRAGLDRLVALVEFHFSMS